VIKIQKKNMFHLVVTSSIPFLSLQIANANQFETPSNPSLSYEWYEGGTTIDQSGMYGTLNTPSGSNIPGSRMGSATSAGGTTTHNIWVFGGTALDSIGSSGIMNDLWQFDPTSGNWTWKSGSKTVSPASNGVYGIKEIPAINNVPGARNNAVSWTDSNGDLWLFGGSGYDSISRRGPLNDLWKYNSTLEQWVWMKGSNSVAQRGTYGVKGTSDPGNTPGARYNSFTAIDSNNNLWLFGGIGYDSLGGQSYLNDLWKYNTITNSWTWMAGSNRIGASAVYGTKGTPAVGNTPAAKNLGKMWVDSTGKIWIFGGFARPSSGLIGNTNDTWSFDPTSGNWTWVSGANTVGQSGNYGTMGVSSSSNIPGARNSFNSWQDTDGNFWIFGGIGIASIPNTGGYLNDLWQYNTTSNTWIWQGGDTTANEDGIWGSQGTTSASNKISPRINSASFSDSTGNFWLFGGFGKDSNGTMGSLNDLWKITY
jgi:N-acetylneuraminic acid mutarotase